MISLRSFLVVAWAATMCLAVPNPIGASVVQVGTADLMVKKGVELAQSRGLEKRLSADFSMEKTWNDEVLFGG